MRLYISSESNVATYSHIYTQQWRRARKRKRLLHHCNSPVPWGQQGARFWTREHWDPWPRTLGTCLVTGTESPGSGHWVLPVPGVPGPVRVAYP